MTSHPLFTDQRRPLLQRLGLGLSLGLVAWVSSACQVEVTLPNQDTSTETAAPAPETSAAPMAPTATATATATAVDDTPTLGSDGRLSTSRRFQGQAFDAAAYSQIPWWGNGCAEYGLDLQPCEYQRDYIFADGTLAVFIAGTEGAGATFTFATPVSLEMAQDYGRILSRGTLSLDQITRQDGNQIVYEVEDFSGAGSFIILDLNPSGQVIAANYGEWSP